MEYWNSKLTVKGDCLNKVPEQPGTLENCRYKEVCSLTSNCSDFNSKTVNFRDKPPIPEQDKSNVHIDDHLLDKEVQTVLEGLLKKANPEELEIIHRILSSEIRGPEWRAALTTLTTFMNQRTCKNKGLPGLGILSEQR